MDILQPEKSSGVFVDFSIIFHTKIKQDETNFFYLKKKQQLTNTLTQSHSNNGYSLSMLVYLKD